MCAILMLWHPVSGRSYTTVLPDQTDRIPDFAPFAARFRQAVERRDADFVRSLLWQDSVVGYSYALDLNRPLSDQQKKLARQTWAAGLDDPQAPFWKDVQRFLQWGASWDQDQKTVEYPNFKVSSRPREEGVSLGETLVTGTGVTVRATPSRSGNVLTSLTWEILPHSAFLERREDYTRFRLSDGRVGYISNDYLWSPAGPWVRLKQIKGEWRLIHYSDYGG